MSFFCLSVSLSLCLSVSVSVFVFVFAFVFVFVFVFVFAVAFDLFFRIPTLGRCLAEVAENVKSGSH